MLFILLSDSTAAENASWTGVWDTQWRNGGAVMELRQEGDRVEGFYPGFEGVMQGRVDGKQLSGTWTDAAGQGVFTFVMSPDRQSFMGRFGTGEWWTGMRTETDIADTLFGRLDLSSPQATLRSFLQAGARAGEGRSDRLGIVVPLLDFSAFEESLTAYDRIDLARLLFQVIDRLTFRVWELQRDEDLADEVEYAANLTQAGTNLAYTLRFRASSDSDSGERTWRLVVPPEAEMRAALEELLVRHDGVLPHAREHHALQSPRDTMRTFVEQWDNARNGNGELFLKTMDLSQIAEAVRQEEGALLGEYLIEVLHRIGLPLRQEIPDDPNRRGPYVHFVHPVGVVEIHPIEQEDGSTRWQFSAETMASARQLFMALEDMPLADTSRRGASTPFFEIRNQVRSVHRDLLNEAGPGVELWQWFALILWLLVSIPISWLLTGMVAKPFQLDESDENRVLSPKVRFFWPLRLIFIAGIGMLALKMLGLPQSVDIPLRVVIGVTLSIAGGWLAYHLVDKISDVLEAHSQRYRYRDEILRSLAISIVKLAVIIGAVLFLAEILSLPYQGVIAGLGIGGLAVALAARSTLENLIGGLTLFADKPVEVGDLCQLGEHLGVIEGIGLRSVKVRSLARTVVTIPNAEFVNLNIENLSRRDRMLLRTTVGLRYETSPDQLRWVLTEIRQLLLQHPMVTPEPARARFLGFGDHSVDIEIFAYIKTNDFNEFLGVQEDIFLRLIEIVEESGTGFAFPSMVNYLASDGGVDDERAERAEAIMRELREGNELPFPNFDVQTRKKMRDTLDYPPEGSVDFEPQNDASA
ncbi:mechanosensitive ion channel family protein [Wenzhouxiangella limi]|uniref:Mechanosensitive ion channel family protein n=1 Tax=Wenzhouxiangella limi TaxID=2707351 RepID=A0A845UYQ2_9GAMM|nr:mechanosensitive ion channel family protein [Wenzhouxiangella limi]NDY96953.1 mechanosensitive ion channel family protein [Wenzhouxiangella limi]